MAQIEHSRHHSFNNFIGHYKIFCVNGNTGFKNESRIFNFIHLQNEEEHERKESSSPDFDNASPCFIFVLI